jgi:TetR/AcrR family transcriptional regulator, cholesterol catabolism regulator
MRKVRTFSSDTDLVKERRSQIVKTATELIVKKGYNRTNTRELATALGMSTGGLYHWIGSKEDILYLIVNFTSDLTQGLLDLCAGCGGNGSVARHLEQCMEIYLKGVEEQRDFHNFINHVMLSLSVNDRRIVYENESRIVAYFEDLLAEGVKTGEFRPHDCKCIAHNIVAIANAWANRGWYLKRYYNIDKYTREQTEALLAQLVASPAPAHVPAK